MARNKLKVTALGRGLDLDALKTSNPNTVKLGNTNPKKLVDAPQPKSKSIHVPKLQAKTPNCLPVTKTIAEITDEKSNISKLPVGKVKRTEDSKS